MLAPKIEILLVDDDSCVTKIVKAVFPERNYWITGVRDPHQALMLCEERVFDLILLDIGLPDMDGYEVLERLQQNPATRCVPVIMLTGSDSVRDKVRALEAGAVDYITKPFEIPELRSRIRAAVRTKILQDQLVLAQKMESIGQLAAGIAHEINTPIQFVGDNLNFLKDSFESLEKLLNVSLVKQNRSEKQEENERFIPIGEPDVSASNLEEYKYLSVEIPKAIHESLEGIHRITDIVKAIGDFSHPASKSPVPSDLNKAIKSTINVARNEWKNVADLELNLDPNLPIIPCFIGELNQAILNLIVNAAQSIAEKGDNQKKGVITVSTRTHENCVEISVSDTGLGIDKETRDRVFDLFFTTKEAGKGTGQGLYITHRVVVEKHGGTIEFQTKEGKGTTFIVRIPRNGRTSLSDEELMRN